MAPQLHLVHQEDAPPSSSTASERLPPLLPEQARLVHMGLSLVERCADEVARRYRDLVTPDDLLAPGTLGLHEAARAYREDLTPSFLHFARCYIEGKMLRSIHAEHFSLRAKVEHAMERAYCRISAHQALGLDLFAGTEAEILDGARKGCDEVLAATYLAGLLEAQHASPEEAVVELEGEQLRRDTLGDALATLPPNEEVVIRLAYGQGMTLGEVADKVGVHLNTAKNRHVSALQKLRAFFLSPKGH
jgi:RNA polymerase sigma factor (sigma-70 family)